jgi:hypothetical protein
MRRKPKQRNSAPKVVKIHGKLVNMETGKTVAAGKAGKRGG